MDQVAQTMEDGEKLDRLKEKNLGGQDLFADTGFYQ